jgi:hypothetical protein
MDTPSVVVGTVTGYVLWQASWHKVNGTTIGMADVGCLVAGQYTTLDHRAVRLVHLRGVVVCASNVYRGGGVGHSWQASAPATHNINTGVHQGRRSNRNAIPCHLGQLRIGCRE